MSFLWITIPATLALAAVLLAAVIRSVLRGDLDDPEGPAARMVFDDDAWPELAAGEGVATAAPPRDADADAARSRAATPEG